jgi:hypothetical protein
MSRPSWHEQEWFKKNTAGYNYAFWDNYTGQPTQDTLDFVREAPLRDVNFVFELMAKIFLWCSGEGACRCDGQVLRLSSRYRHGAEMAIRALQMNESIWRTTWLSSVRGGTYVFRIPKKGEGGLV